MKIKRFLAVALAAAMLLGLSTAAAAAPSPEAQAAAVALELDMATTVDLSEKEELWFRFTAPEDGHYSFRSSGGNYGEHDTHTLPYAAFYDSRGARLESFDDWENNNFAGFFPMQLGETIYLYASLHLYEENNPRSYTVKVSAYDPVLALNTNEITLYYRDVVNFEALLQGTGLQQGELKIMPINRIHLDMEGQNLVAKSKGTTTFTLMTLDGAAAQVKVTVKYSAKQWLCMIFLAGWLWMPFSPPGTFHPGESIRHFFDEILLDLILELLALSTQLPAYIRSLFD